MPQGRLHIEVAYALPERQKIISLLVDPGTTIAEAIELSGIRQHFDDLEVVEHSVGVFGRRRPPDHVLRDGDRVEIYRPLVADPKERRRARARGESG